MFILETILYYLFSCLVNMLLSSSLYAATPIVANSNIHLSEQNIKTFMEDISIGQGKYVDKSKVVAIIYSIYGSEKDGGELIAHRGNPKKPYIFMANDKNILPGLLYGVIGNDTNHPMKQGGKRRVTIINDPAASGKTIHYDINLLSIL